MSKTIVVGRTGESISGDLLTKRFSIKSTFGATLKLKTRDIKWIHFRNPPNIELDEVWTASGDRIRGAIAGEAIDFRPDGGGAIEIPYAKIHTIIVNQAWSPSRGISTGAPARRRRVVPRGGRGRRKGR